MFAAATAAATPKLFIAIFIGSRLAVIAKSGEKMDAATKVINWASIVFGVVLGALTGWFIYKRYACLNRSLANSDRDRTLARSRQIEIEERASQRRPPSQSGEFVDDPEDETDTAALIRDDQIDFLDSEDAYRDEFTDDEDVFDYGGRDEEGAIGLDKQPAQR